MANKKILLRKQYHGSKHYDEIVRTEERYARDKKMLNDAGYFPIAEEVKEEAKEPAVKEKKGKDVQPAEVETDKSEG